MVKAKGQKRQSTENELMSGIDHISNPKVRAYIIKKKKEKEEAKRFRQTGGERGAAARAAKEAKGIHGKMDLSEESDDDQMESESQEEEVVVKQVATIKKKAPGKLAKKKISK